MEELIKVAPNGQWTLEKAKKNDSEIQRMIAEFLARKNAPPEPRPNPTAGLQAVQHSTGANPDWTKEQVAAFRAGIPADVVTRAAPRAAGTPPPVAQKVNADMSRRQQQDDEQAKTTQNRKAAWEAGVAFLAQHGDKGMKALQSQMQQRKALDNAHATGKMPVKPKPALLPPQEPFVDEKTGQRGMRERQGTYHNQGATTTGKIVNKGIAYQDKQTGEMVGRSVPQQEQHHWSWDHNNKKWNHVKTTLGNPTIR